MPNLARSVAAHSLYAGVMALCLAATPVLAADWKWGARTGLSSNYDSNPTLTDDDEDPEDTFRFLAFVDMDFENIGPSSGFTISPRVSRDYYPDSDKSDLESTDFTIPGSAFYAMPTARWGVSYGFTRQNILSSETIAEGGGDPRNFRADDIVYNYTVTPNFSWNPTQVDQFLVSGGWSKQDYDKDYTGRSDFEGYAFNSSYVRSLTARQSLGFTGTFQSSESEGLNCFANFPIPPETRPPATEPCDTDNDPPNSLNGRNKNESDSSTLTLDYTFRWSPTLEFKASFGLQNTDLEQTVLDENGGTLLLEGQTINGVDVFVPVEKIESNSDGDTYNFTVTKETKRSQIRFSAKRSTVLQSSTGTPQDTDDFRLNWDTKLTERLALDTTFQYQERESSLLTSDDNDTGLSRKREFYSAEGLLRYRISTKWSVVTSYRYRKRDNEPRVINANSDNIVSTSNQYRVGITYAFKTIY